MSIFRLAFFPCGCLSAPNTTKSNTRRRSPRRLRKLCFCGFETPRILCNPRVSLSLSDGLDCEVGTLLFGDMPYSLEYRARADMIHVYKITTGLDDVNMESLFIINHQLNRGDKIQALYSRRDAKLYSFTNQTVDMWNRCSNDTTTRPGSQGKMLPLLTKMVS